MTAYHTLSDLHQFGISAEACGRVSSGDQQAIVDARNAWADGKLRGRYQLPLLAWDVDLRMMLAQVSAYDVMIRRGYNPAAAADINIRLRFDDAIAWFNGVERGNTHPNVTESPKAAAVTPSLQAPLVLSSPKRGW